MPCSKLSAWKTRVKTRKELSAREPDNENLRDAAVEILPSQKGVHTVFRFRSLRILAKKDAVFWLLMTTPRGIRMR